VPARKHNKFEIDFFLRKFQTWNYQNFKNCLFTYRY